MHNTIAFSGGFRYRPTTSIELLLELRVVGHLERLDQMRLQAQRPTRPAAPSPD